MKISVNNHKTHRTLLLEKETEAEQLLLNHLQYVLNLHNVDAGWLHEKGNYPLVSIVVHQR